MSPENLTVSRNGTNEPLDKKPSLELIYESRKPEKMTLATTVLEQDEIQGIRIGNGARLERTVSIRVESKLI